MKKLLFVAVVLAASVAMADITSAHAVTNETHRLSDVIETAPGSMAPTWKGCHVQGFAFSDDAAYLGVDRSGIYKFDLKGMLLAHVDTPNHTGDICWHKGRLYTSVLVLAGPRPKHSGIVQVYDGNLKLLREAFLEQGVDGICARDDKLYLGMFTTSTCHRVNQIGVMDIATLALERRMEIDTGCDTAWGPQGLTCVDGDFWVSFYSERPLVVFDADWKPKFTFDLTASAGLSAVPASMRGSRPRIGRGTNFQRADGDVAYRIDFHELSDGKLIPVSSGLSQDGRK